MQMKVLKIGKYLTVIKTRKPCYHQQNRAMTM